MREGAGVAGPDPNTKQASESSGGGSSIIRFLILLMNNAPAQLLGPRGAMVRSYGAMLRDPSSAAQGLSSDARCSAIREQRSPSSTLFEPAARSLSIAPGSLSSAAQGL